MIFVCRDILLIGFIVIFYYSVRLYINKRTQYIYIYIYIYIFANYLWNWISYWSILPLAPVLGTLCPKFRNPFLWKGPYGPWDHFTFSAKSASDLVFTGQNQAFWENAQLQFIGGLMRSTIIKLNQSKWHFIFWRNGLLYFGEMAFLYFGEMALYILKKLPFIVWRSDLLYVFTDLHMFNIACLSQTIICLI